LKSLSNLLLLDINITLNGLSNITDWTQRSNIGKVKTGSKLEVISWENGFVLYKYEKNITKVL
jgi:hypothetical protein